MADDKVKGVYSAETNDAAQVGMSRRKGQSRRFFVVWEQPGGELVVQALNRNMSPAGIRRTYGREEFAERFTHESDFVYSSRHNKVMRREKAQLDAGEHTIHLDAEMEARPAPEPRKPAGKKAAKPTHSPYDFENDRIVRSDLRGKDELREKREMLYGEDAEMQARSDFARGIAQLKRGNMRKAREILEGLAERDDLEFEPKHKHMFNEFGIDLRKSNMLPTAVKQYERAVGLSPDDENLYHNLARACFEQGDTANAVRYLRKSLKINPDLHESRLFLDYIRRMTLE